MRRLQRSLPASLTLRVALLFALLACVVVGGLGSYLYMSARNSLEARADLALIGRVEHFRTLLHDLYNVNQIEMRPALFETMLGNEDDVIVFRKAGAPPFISVNPTHTPLPDITPAPVSQMLALSALHEGAPVNGVRTHWVAALAQVGTQGDVVEIIAAHVMTQEARMQQVYLFRVWLAVSIAVLSTALLGYAVLSRGLRPLRAMAERAAEITPTRLSMRLHETGAPSELRQLAASFNAMLDRLADGYDHLSQFSADLAHEIRTPIGVLIGQTQVALGQLRSVDEYQALLESNLEELDRLSRMVENILFLAHADHAGLTIDKAPLPLADELARIADYFDGLADERQLTFAVEASGVVFANSMLWRRAVSNLVVNAVRYATPGSVARLSGLQRDGATLVMVENDGAPIAQAQLDRLFDRFYRGDAARSESTESNGLGLSIVRAIMTLHGGSVGASCTPQGRVCFTLCFPLPPGAASTPSTASPATPAAAQPSPSSAPLSFPSNPD